MRINPSWIIVALLGGCALSSGEPEVPIPDHAGSYPRRGRASAGWMDMADIRRDAGWRPAFEFETRAEVAASAGGFLRAVPGIGSPVQLRGGIWPAPVRVASISDEAVVVQGEWVAAEALTDEVRCAGIPGTAPAPIRLVGVATPSDVGLLLSVRYEGPAELGCELSTAGRGKLQAAAFDLWVWARAVARAGAEIPARLP